MFVLNVEDQNELWKSCGIKLCSFLFFWDHQSIFQRNLLLMISFFKATIKPSSVIVMSLHSENNKINLELFMSHMQRFYDIFLMQPFSKRVLKVLLFQDFFPFKYRLKEKISRALWVSINSTRTRRSNWARRKDCWRKKET